MRDFIVYMLFCSDESYYIGVTADLDKRLEWHRQGLDPFCYTYSRRPVQVAWAESFSDWNEALARERQVKGWSRAKKQALIEGNWAELQRLSLGPRQADPDC